MIWLISFNTAWDRTLVIPTSCQPGRVHRVAQEFGQPGGKPLNILRVLCALNTPVTALVAVGGDVGHLIATGLRKEGLWSHCLPVWLDETSRICDILVEDNNGIATVFNTPGPLLSAQGLVRLQEALGELGQRVSEGDWVVISGQFPPGTEAPLEPVVRRLAREGRARLAVDASDTVLKMFVKPPVDLVKVNAEEFWMAFGNGTDVPESPDEILRQALDWVPQFRENYSDATLIVTLGRKGSVLWTGREGYYVESLPVTAVNATGSGDAYLAGLLAAREAQTGWLAATCWASAAAAMNAAQMTQGVSDLPGVMTWVPAVPVHKLNLNEIGG